MITVEGFLAGHGIVMPESQPEKSPKGEHAGRSARKPSGNSAGRAGRRGMGAERGEVTGIDAGVSVADDSRAAAPCSIGDDDIDACREAALRLLDAAPRSSGGLKQRLLDKEFEEPVIDEVIGRLTKVLLINDEAYAESAVRYCLSRNMGARFTQRELLRKGVDRELAQRVVSAAEEEGCFVDAAYELGRTVLRKTKGLDPIRRKRRLWSTAGRKGHSPDTIRQVANELFD
ncbi:regulatory protein RecX [Bifidobacterium sp.]|uniref:regulatory protein RecX n=1 Tax=Bifidobacterium sp. TaxID=41200 RepID=UPI0039EC1652